MLDFERCLRTEIGVVHIHSAGQITDVEKIYSFIDEKRKIQ